MLRNLPALLLLALLPLGLGGCLFDHPLTSPTSLTSPAIDSRLFGVFEYREAPKAAPGTDLKPEDYIIHRLAVLPLGPNHFVAFYRTFGKKKTPLATFTGWMSRVDEQNYISFRDDTEGAASFGKYGFFRYEWTFPSNILLYAPDAKSFEATTSPYTMRRALRAGLKAGTAFPFEATTWSRIARISWKPAVWWNPASTEAEATIPPEFEHGTTRDNPGL